MRSIFVLLGLFALAIDDRASAQCRADFDSSGAVEINELIAAVGEALSGCGSGPATPTRRQPTPTRTPTNPPSDRCPSKFNDAVDADRFCGYFGQVTSPRCQSFPVGSGWTTEGQDVVALLADTTGTIGVFGVRNSPTRVTVDSVAFGPDFDEFFNATGSMNLPNNRTLAVTAAFGSECGALTHNGTFEELLGGSAGASVGGLLSFRAEMRGGVAGVGEVASARAEAAKRLAAKIVASNQP